MYFAAYYCLTSRAPRFRPCHVMPAQALGGARLQKRAHAVPGPQKRRASALLQTRKRVPTAPHHCAGEPTLLESLLEDFVPFLVFLSSVFRFSSFFLSLFVFLLNKLSWSLPLAPALVPPQPPSVCKLLCWRRASSS